MLVLVLLVAGSSAAQPDGAGGLEATPAVLRGAVGVDIAHATLWAGPGDAVEVRLERGDVLVEGYEMATAHGSADAATVVLHSWEERVTLENATLLLRPTTALAGAVRGVRTDASLVRIGALDEERRLSLHGTRGRHYLVEEPTGSFVLAADAPFRAAGGELVLEAGTVSGALDRTVGRGDTAGILDAGVRNVTFLTVRGVFSAIHAPALASPTFLAVVDGEARFPAASGWIDDGGHVRLAEDDLVLEGSFHVEGFRPEDRPASLRALPLPEGDGRGRFLVAGTFRGVDVNGVPLLARPSAVAAASGVAALVFLAWLYSRIAPGNAARNPMRARILERVRAEPGIQQERLAGDVGVAWGTIRYHLHVLARHGFVETRTEGRYRLVYLRTAPPAPIASVRARGRAFDVYELLREGGAASAPEVASRLRLAPQLVYYHLATLRRLGLVEPTDARPARWAAREPPASGKP